MTQKKAKSFWKRPEGITGGLVMVGLTIGAVVLINAFI